MFVSIYPLVDRRIFSRQLSIVLIHYDTVVGDGNTSRMAFKIDMGWFQGNFGQILSRFTWELPQTLFGHLGSQTENLFEGVKSVSYYGGATAVETYSAKWGGFTLGSFIIGHRGLHADPNNSLFQHEYGHYLQSRASGPLYLGKYAIPSFYDTMFGRGNHKYHSVEQDANARAIKYFEKRIPGFADRRNKGINEGWDHYKYPIVGYDVQGGFYSARVKRLLIGHIFRLLKVHWMHLWPYYL